MRSGWRDFGGLDAEAEVAVAPGGGWGWKDGGG